MSDPNLMNSLAGGINPRGGAVREDGSLVLKYPLSLGDPKGDSQNFVLFHAKPGGPHGRGQSSADNSTIALYIPPNALKTKFTGNYTPLTGGAIYEREGTTLAAGMTGAAVAATLARRFKGVATVVGALSGIGIKNIYKDISENDTSVMDGIVNAMNKQSDESLDFAKSIGGLAIANFGGALGPATAAMGIGLNPHIAMVYQGPGSFRTHDMVFDFWPRDYTEARMVKMIVQDFKARMLPKMHDFIGISSVFFNFPHEFFIDFYIGTKDGPKRFDQMGIRRSVLTSMDINFDSTAQGPAFYTSPDYADQEPLPVHTRLSLMFQETEFILNNARAAKSTTDQRQSTEHPLKPSPNGITPQL